MLDRLAGLLTVGIEHGRIWTVGGWKVSAKEIFRRSSGEPFRVDLVAIRGSEERRVSLHVRLHPSSWIEACVEVEGFAGRHFFIERIYEEFEIWPPGSDCMAMDSGRMGKRCGWVQLEAACWPELAFLAEDRFITLEPAEREAAT